MYQQRQLLGDIIARKTVVFGINSMIEYHSFPCYHNYVKNLSCRRGPGLSPQLRFFSHFFPLLFSRPLQVRKFQSNHNLVLYFRQRNFFILVLLLFILFLQLVNSVSLEFRHNIAQRVKVRQGRKEIAVTNQIIISVFHGWGISK